MRTCNDRQVPKPATGKTPVRNARVPDEIWLPALAKAEALGETATDAVERGLRWYASEAIPAAYEFTFANWPDAATWHRSHSTSFTAMEAELDAAAGFLPAEWLTVATWLAATHHERDLEQQKRVITGHILRRAFTEDNFGAWRDRYRDSRHLSETVQAIIRRHLPLEPGE